MWALSYKDFKAQAANQRGISLVVVLWVLALLMIIASELVYTARVDSQSAMNFKDGTAAQALAMAGIDMGAAEIAAPYKLVALDADGRTVFIRQENNESDPGSRSFELGEGRVAYAIEDESGKLNLNTASREIVKNLLENSGVENSALDTIVDSIMDWRDENHEHHLNGAEDDFYRSLPKPYGAKDGLLDTAEEALLIKGMRPEIFYGTENVRKEGRGDSPAVSAFKGISGHITVRGDGKININTASEGVLKAALGEGRTQEILLRRKTEGYYELPSFGGVVNSGIFSIISSGTVRGLSYSVRAMAEKRGTEVRIVYLKEESYPAGTE